MLFIVCKYVLVAVVVIRGEKETSVLIKFNMLVVLMLD